jgi:hypothetical protein
MLRNPGWITLPDGTKIEEDMCSQCRGYALNPPDDRTFAHQDLTEMSFVFSPNGVTRPRGTDNYTRDN